MFGAYTFIFDNIISSRYNLKLLYSDTDTGLTSSTGTPNKNYTTIVSARKSKREIIGCTIDEVLSFDLEILVDNSDENGHRIPIKRNEIGQIRKWLFNKATYGKLVINQDSLTNCYFNVIFKDVEDINVDGEIIGFKCTAECDNTGCYKKAKYEYECSGSGSFKVYCEHSNVFTVKPTWTIIPDENTTDVTISTEDDEMTFTSIHNGTIKVDVETLIINSTNVLDNFFIADTFNMHFLELHSGDNTINVNGACKVICEFENVLDVGG